MKKKTRQTISVEISVDSLREEAVAYMNDVFEHACIHPDICPSDEQLESDFNRNIQDPDFIRHIQYMALASIKENILNIFEDHYEDEYIQDLIERTIDISGKELEQRDAEKQKHLESAKTKLAKIQLTPEEREALGLKS